MASTYADILQTVSGKLPAFGAKAQTPSAQSVLPAVAAGLPLPWSAYVRLLSVRDPYILEFLDLKDEYSESDLEDALISRLEMFLLELGGDFAFIGRQKRLRIGDEWYRVDLVFFHRHLRCLIVIDLKIGKFTPADAGQMHLYLNYARRHWTRDHENPPVGLILCAQKERAVARYALEGLPNKVLAAEYKLALPTNALSRCHGRSCPAVRGPVGLARSTRH